MPVSDHTVTLSQEAHRIICGLVNGTSVVDPDYVIPDTDDTWVEVRNAFPVSGYRDMPPDSDGEANDGWGSALVDSESYRGPMES